MKGLELSPLVEGNANQQPIESVPDLGRLHGEIHGRFQVGLAGFVELEGVFPQG
jgi:hypothetical protein